MLFTVLLVPSPLPPLIFLISFLHHCKLFPSLQLKWHLQMRVKSGRQWISNWKRHWTEDNATGSVISNQMIWNVKWCEIVAELNFMLPPSSMQHFFFFSNPLFRRRSEKPDSIILMESFIFFLEGGEKITVKGLIRINKDKKVSLCSASFKT